MPNDALTTWKEIARVLDIDLMQLSRLRDHPDSPKGRDLAEWQTYILTRPGYMAKDDATTAAPGGESFAEARTRREVAGADREEFNRDIAKIERDKLRGTLVTKKEAVAAAAAVRDAFVAVGKQLWPKMDTVLGDGLSASERQKIAQALRQAWDALLTEISA